MGRMDLADLDNWIPIPADGPDETAYAVPMSSLDISSIDAVVFDIGGVFLIPHAEPISEALAEVGIEVDPTDHAAWHRAHHVGVRVLADHVKATGAVPDEHASPIWEAYDAGYFPEVGVAAADLAAASAARASLRDRASVDVWSMPMSDNIVASRRIAGARPIAVVSNNNGAAEQQMLDHGVGQVGPGPLPTLAAVVDSELEGVAKPDPAIFDRAVAALGVDRSRILYVGDTWHADVVGANAAGLQVVQLDPHDLHADFDHHRLPNLDALAGLLA